MDKKAFGKTELLAPPLIFGGNVFGWTLDQKSSFNILDAALDHGLNFIDTANSYAHWAPGNKGGESETIIGKWLKEKGGRDKVIIATKVGSSMGKGAPKLSKKHILEEVHHSLRRLNTDYIDLYQSHHDDPNTPIEETMETYASLVKAGKVRYIGASNFSIKRFQEANKVATKNDWPTYQSIQPEYNLYDRAAFEKNLAPEIDPSKIAVISYYSLASGFLSGKYRSKEDLGKSKRGAGIEKYLTEKGIKILNLLDKIAEKYHTVPASIALAWLISRPKISAPIASATSLQQIKSLVEASTIHLKTEDLKALDKVSAWK